MVHLLIFFNFLWIYLYILDFFCFSFFDLLVFFNHISNWTVVKFSGASSVLIYELIFELRLVGVLLYLRSFKFNNNKNKTIIIKNSVH